MSQLPVEIPSLLDVDVSVPITITKKKCKKRGSACISRNSACGANKKRSRLRSSVPSTLQQGGVVNSQTLKQDGLGGDDGVRNNPDQEGAVHLQGGGDGNGETLGELEDGDGMIAPPPCSVSAYQVVHYSCSKREEAT